VAKLGIKYFMKLMRKNALKNEKKLGNQERRNLSDL
jgi:hypothetical protein